MFFCEETNYWTIINKFYINSHVFLGKDEEEEVSLDSDSDQEISGEDAGLCSIGFCFLKLLNIPENRLWNLPQKSFLWAAFSIQDIFVLFINKGS